MEEERRVRSEAQVSHPEKEGRAAEKPASAPAEAPWLTFASPEKADSELSPREAAERERPRVLASLSNGVPFLVERRMARGRVLFVSSGLHSPWNTLTRTNAVLLFDRIFRAALEE